MSYNTQLPGYTRDSEAFWKAGARGVLCINRCGNCGTWHHPPQPICHHCLSDDVSCTAVNGKGTIVSFTVNHQPWLPGMPVPFVIAFVEPEECPGIWLMTNIIECDPSLVHIGQAVTVHFERHDEVWLPLFKPEKM